MASRYISRRAAAGADLAEVEEAQLAAALAHHREAAAAEIGGFRPDHDLRQHGGDGGVDRVAAAPQDLGAGVGGQLFVGRHRAAGAGQGRPRGGRGGQGRHRQKEQAAARDEHAQHGSPPEAAPILTPPPNTTGFSVTLPAMYPAPAPAARPALFTLFAIVVIDLVGFGIVIPILPFYADSFGAGATVLGLLVTCYSGCQFLFAPLWGRLSDRIGRRPVMLATIAGTALSLALLGWAPSLAWLFAGRLLGGAFGANISVASAYITDLTSEKERTKYMGFLGASFGVGFVLGPAAGGLLAPHGFALPMGGRRPRRRQHRLRLLHLEGAAAPRGGGRARRPARRVFLARRRGPSREARFRLIRRPCAAVFVFTFAVSQLETLFAYFMMERFAYDAARVAYILVFMAFMMILVQGGGLRVLVRRFGEPRLLQAGAPPADPFAGAGALRPQRALAAAAAGDVGDRPGPMLPSMMGLLANAAPASRRGVVMGAFQSSASLARVAGPFAAGLLYDAARPAPSSSPAPPWCWCSGLALRSPAGGRPALATPA